MLYDLSIVWLRRDLRLEDNSALFRACRGSHRVAVMFNFDTSILCKLKSKSDQRVTFIYDTIVELDQQLRKFGSGLIVTTGDPVVEVPRIAKKLKANAVYFNEDYEPSAKARDTKVRSRLELAGVKCLEFKDHVIFAHTEICKPDGSPYKMYTPYKNSWLKRLGTLQFEAQTFENEKLVSWVEITNRVSKTVSSKTSPIPPMPTLENLGFERSKNFHVTKPGRKAASLNLKRWAEHLGTYHTTRDFPEVDHGTSGLSVHLRFGTISIRECVRLATRKPSLGSQVWLSELIWRDFYQMILDQFPHVAHGSFKKQYDKIKWLGSGKNFKLWSEGRTGFPIVDAGMRQLNQTGWMHNRLRMVTASFLVKDLLVDWRKGERYFSERLLDFDLAANNGGWQWCASTGCDSQPYFRIFNPVLQSQRFDPECKFIKRWLPELRSLSAKEIHLLPLQIPKPTIAGFRLGRNYPKPIVSHSVQKLLAVKMYDGSPRVFLD
ncbi:MAG: deoxyribodipyrimidine photo-lyase [Bdellovibrionales bacterium]|nr:deoxyribodipyrimidine photo-lyase [Bdellovibrionales bacterium]